MHKNSFSILRLLEDDGDMLALFNMIYNRDARNLGYNWVKQAHGLTDIRKIFNLMPQTAFVGGANYVTEEEQVDPATVPVEHNERDPRIQSTDPEFNPCAAFYGAQDGPSVCRVTGKPCLFTIKDYTSCGIRTHALSGNPEYWQIPFGKEQDIAYVHGLKD